MSSTSQPQPLPPLSKSKAIESASGVGRRGKGRGDVFQQQRDFVTHWNRRLRGSESTVWNYLWSVANRDGRMCFVANDTIAARTGLNERTVRRCVKVLEECGVLEVERRERYHRGLALGYRIPFRIPTP